MSQTKRWIILVILVGLFGLFAGALLLTAPRASEQMQALNVVQCSGSACEPTSWATTLTATPTSITWMTQTACALIHIEATDRPVFPPRTQVPGCW